MLDDFDLAVACRNNLYYTAADATRKHWALGDHSCGWGLQVVVYMESPAAMISCSVTRRVRSKPGPNKVRRPVRGIDAGSTHKHMSIPVEALAITTHRQIKQTLWRINAQDGSEQQPKLVPKHTKESPKVDQKAPRNTQRPPRDEGKRHIISFSTL